MDKAAHRVIHVVHILVPTLCTKRVRLLTSDSPHVLLAATVITCTDGGERSEGDAEVFRSVCPVMDME